MSLTDKEAEELEGLQDEIRDASDEILRELMSSTG